MLWLPALQHTGTSRATAPQPSVRVQCSHAPPDRVCSNKIGDVYSPARVFRIPRGALISRHMSCAPVTVLPSGVVGTHITCHKHTEMEYPFQPIPYDHSTQTRMHSPLVHICRLGALWALLSVDWERRSRLPGFSKHSPSALFRMDT